ncbi:gliding motility-associated C-terminal domain-containing protein [Parapedobacter sp. GCM10030251]|uniref:gliding motility-associated C-terminal domain-containing protein n=1 Tax=Parapedobacter sp. GCM10030251 TaxID=3273419 RepID=UPI00361F058A
MRKRTITDYLLRIGILMATWFLSLEGYAQNGSVGDPIINITFGTVSNPDFGGGTTTYFHEPTSPLTDGEYRLASNINQARSGWHNLRDHTTGQGDGLMLVVNASYDAGEFYRIRVSGLCKSTRFRFSAWIANANRAAECGGRPIPPNVRFVVEDLNGSVINSYETGDIQATSSPQWREYGFEFDTGDQSEFDLVLINENPGGCGNDLAIDDIQFRPYGPQLLLNMDEALRQMDTLFFCGNDPQPISLRAEIVSDDSYVETPAYQWQTRREGEISWVDMPQENNEQLRITPVHNRWYRVTVAATTDNLTNSLCRISSDSIRLAQVVTQTDVADEIALDPICVGESIRLDPPGFGGAGVGPITYQWVLDQGNGTVILPGATSAGYEFQAREAGTARLQRQVVNSCGDVFVTHVFEIEVNESVRTALVLPRDVVCADDEPLLLSGGTLVNSDKDGVYSGNGVINGRFYPALAGVGAHTITFSPPPGTPCADSSQDVITVLDSIYLEPMADVVLPWGQSITLSPQTNASQFSWSSQPGLDNYQVRDPIASPSETTTYTLTASNAAGCEKTAEITITVLRDLKVPNGFTPNGDGFNDTWEIDGLAAYPNLFIRVFNRWGALVFSSKGYATPWDGYFNGAPLPTATYYYVITSDALAQPISGSISILK